MIVKNIFLILCFILTSSCAMGNDIGAHLDIFGMPNVPTDGPIDYRKGWADGCETGITAYGNANMRIRYSVQIDTNQITNNILYKKGWELGNRYCGYYTSYYLKSGILGPSDFGIGDTTEEDLREEDLWFNGGGEIDWFDRLKIPDSLN